jgi:hypothetical protein
VNLERRAHSELALDVELATVPGGDPGDDGQTEARSWSLQGVRVGRTEELCEQLLPVLC